MTIILNQAATQEIFNLHFPGKETSIKDLSLRYRPSFPFEIASIHLGTRLQDTLYIKYISMYLDERTESVER